jgi:hypothetical protein
MAETRRQPHLTEQVHRTPEVRISRTPKKDRLMVSQNGRTSEESW